MKLRISLLVAIACMLMLFTQAQQKPDIIPLNPKIKTGKLANGLKVFYTAKQ